MCFCFGGVVGASLLFASILGPEIGSGSGVLDASVCVCVVVVCRLAIVFVF